MVRLRSLTLGMESCVTISLGQLVANLERSWSIKPASSLGGKLSVQNVVVSVGSEAGACDEVPEADLGWVRALHCLNVALNAAFWIKGNAVDAVPIPPKLNPNLQHLSLHTRS